jgi:hypothetical protein
MAAGPEQIEQRYIEKTFAISDDPDWDAARKEVSRKIDVQLNTVAETKNLIN